MSFRYFVKFSSSYSEIISVVSQPVFSVRFSECWFHFQKGVKTCNAAARATGGSITSFTVFILHVAIALAGLGCGNPHARKAYSILPCSKTCQGLAGGRVG